jgi:putative transposase
MNLDTAFSNFFAKRAKYPNFKCRRNYGGSAKFDTYQFKLKEGKLQLPKLDSLIKVNWTRELPQPPKFVTISQDSCGDFWASFTCEVDHQPLPAVNQEVGIDLGITAFATLSTGDKVKAPDLRRKIARVKILQKRASRKAKSSNNKKKANRKVARAYRKVTNTRKDFQHKLSRKLVNENQVIALEDLAVKNMVKNRKLARAISEQGWADFVTMIEYKARWAGRTVTRVDRFFPSSKTCHGCGHVVKKLPLNVREWVCPGCGTNHDRDINAAKNILAAGRVVSACGVDGRPVSGLRKKAVGCEAGRNK